MATSKQVTIHLDQSTWKWLEAFARANSNTELNQKKVTTADLLKVAAMCIADHAGRSMGWRADAALQMMMPAGFQSKINWKTQAKMQLQESAEGGNPS